MNRRSDRGRARGVFAALGILLAATASARAQKKPAEAQTLTPIKHVILIIGENRTFDQVFGMFLPRKGQRVRNLLSEGILEPDGSPGPHFARARQWIAAERRRYSLHPERIRPYPVLPRPNTDGAQARPFFPSAAAVAAIEPGLPADARYRLAVGGTGLPPGVADTRFPANLPNGPFVISNWVSEEDYAGSPVHGFFKMWQQSDCDPGAATPRNPSGCRSDLYPWVAITAAAGRKKTERGRGAADQATHQGGVAMGVYDMAEGDVGYFDALAHRFALSDNYHQAIMGPTGPNHVAIGFGTALYYAAPDGAPAPPPSQQVADPNPIPHTDNAYTRGGSYVACGDRTAPGVRAIRDYLAALPYQPFRGGDCRKGAYYLIGNRAPGYLGDGRRARLGPGQPVAAPSRQPNLGLLLSAHHVSWRYYGGGWNGGKESVAYCNICNPFLYSTQIMTAPALRANLQGIRALYADIGKGALPAVALVKPDGFVDGHPGSSKIGLFEAFCRKIVGMVRGKPDLWRDTAIMITFDEGGGYYDSGYIQPIDFFGDGPRVPLIVVSPYSKDHGVVHTYADHVSFDKFVEANWKLPTIGPDSRDNLPDPIASKAGPYVPANPPAIGDLMDMFDFPGAKAKGAAHRAGGRTQRE